MQTANILRAYAWQLCRSSHLTYLYQRDLRTYLFACGDGLIAGFVGRKIVNKHREGLILDIVFGIVGAVVGGYLFNVFGASGLTGLNLYSLPYRLRPSQLNKTRVWDSWPMCDLQKLQDTTRRGHAFGDVI
jgi:Transglycosylase associated protein